ncbi:FitA-like ribbon-helix-helix domain-containing protein [Glaciibacter sp. 2TAF33]|uniref:FitA-like ribbon-helix-helix domain-containing protein n=1 Tax=Glaciibacter sp. 2TAF33 TaxID=3233015 RepID=UPI003F92D31A
MAVTITIRAVPDEVRDELAARAARTGRSLQEYLSAELAALASRPSPAEALARIRSRAAHYPPIDASEIVTDVAADRP